MSLKRRYIVTKGLRLNNKVYVVGQEIPHNQLKYLTEEQKLNNIYIQDFNKAQIPFNYGLIFLSKEFPHPEGGCEETREEMEARLLCEQKDCHDKTED